MRKKEDEMKDLNAKLSLNEPQHSGEISQLKNKVTRSPNLIVQVFTQWNLVK